MLFKPLKNDERLGLLEHVLESGGIGFFEVEAANGQVQLRWDPFVCRFMGIEEDLTEMGFLPYLNHFCHPGDRDRVNTALKRALEARQDTYAVQFRVWNEPKGQWIWLHVFGRVHPTSTSDHMVFLGGVQELPDVLAFQDAALQALDSDARSQIMLDHNPICCVFFSEEYRVIDCNMATIRLLQLDNKTEYMAQYLKFVPERQPGGQPSLAMIRERLVRALNGETQSFEVLLWDVNEEEIPVQVTLILEELKTQRIIIAYLQDLRQLKATLTELDREREELRLARDEAEASAKAKSEFLATMSHEIRTPMNAIIGVNHLLARTELSEKQRQLLEMSDQSAKDLLKIINDILDYSKLEEGSLGVNHLRFSLSHLMGELVQPLEEQITAKGLDFKLNVQDGLPDLLEGDPQRLKQVLQNLLENALKFTDQGSISIEISQWVRKGRFLQLLFAIRDSGIGMSEQQRQRLFKPFSQVDSSSTRTYGGTGLGLAICRNLVQIMNGDIWCESESGRGSAFFFTASFECAIDRRAGDARREDEI